MLHAGFSFLLSSKITTFIPSIVILLENLVSNLFATYFNPAILLLVPSQDLVYIIDYAHSYLMLPFPLDFTIVSFTLTAYL